MKPADLLRRARLRTLMALHLENWRETWDGYVGTASARPLRFRDGTVLAPDCHGAPGFLFLEVFANKCYARGVSGGDAGVVVDLGANVGAFTLFWAMRHPRCRIHAYEPDPQVCRVLRENVRANRLDDRVTIWEEAVAARECALTFARGLSSLEGRLAPSAAADGVVVPAVSLATVLQRAGGAVSLLKVDVEGAEADVFDTAGDQVAAVDEVIGEYHDFIVPDVVARLRRAFESTHRFSVHSSRRCGPMFHALRRHGATPRVNGR
jgi:FkbM family methyltransferase